MPISSARTIPDGLADLLAPVLVPQGSRAETKSPFASSTYGTPNADGHLLPLSNLFMRPLILRVRPFHVPGVFPHANHRPNMQFMKQEGRREMIVPRGLLVLFLLTFASAASAAEYVIDTQGQHAFIQFRIKHLGYSWLYGRFDRFSGHFTFDENDPESSRVEVEIDTTSIDTNHEERDKHLRGKEFFDVEKYPKATFVSTDIRRTGEKTGIMKGNLTLKGVTKPVTIDVEFIGSGPDPWGGHRAGFQGKTSVPLQGFNILYDLGPESREAEIILSIEGLRR
jgi:polyisoprenoid-binding protein YceI